MSTSYITEPPCSGKILLKTTVGDIDIELWPREAPLACKNFIAHALHGYYDNHIFHRVIKGAFAQTGDPTGTGKGGQSIYGKPFKDEVHGRIKFDKRGQVACANEQVPNSNHSQFFMTFAPCEWLNKKHTIFGKVTGQTIFNLLRMSDVDVDSEDRPTDDIRVIGVEVISNPFPDMSDINYDLVKNGNKKIDHSATKNVSGKAARKAVLDAKLVSFGGGDDGEGEVEIEEMWQPKKKKQKRSMLPTSTSANRDAASMSMVDMNRSSSCLQEPSAAPFLQINNSALKEEPALNTTFQSSKDKLQRLKQKLADSKRLLETQQQGKVGASAESEKATGALSLSLVEQQRALYSKGKSKGKEKSSKKSGLFKATSSSGKKPMSNASSSSTNDQARDEDALLKLNKVHGQ